MSTMFLAQYDDNEGLKLLEAIEKANSKGMRILNNLEIDQRLKTDQWKSEKEMFPCWTGTLIAYNPIDVPLGKTIESNNLVINVPKQFQGKVNVAILCNHPDFTLKGNIVTLGKSAKCIPIPKSDGWYLPDPQFGFPNQENPNNSPDVRYLWRASSYAGLLARNYGGRFGGGGRVVVADWWYYGRLGVFVSDENKLFNKKFNQKMKHKHDWKTVCISCGEEKP